MTASLFDGYDKSQLTNEQLLAATIAKALKLEIGHVITQAFPQGDDLTPETMNAFCAAVQIALMQHTIQMAKVISDVTGQAPRSVIQVFAENLERAMIATELYNAEKEGK